MLAPRSEAEFLERPHGGYVAGSAWLYFVMPEDVHGYALWGTPQGDDVAALVARMEIELTRPPHKALVDLSGLDVVEAAAFGHLVRYVERHAAALRRSVEHTAMVLPGGLNRAITAGFFSVVDAPFPVSHWEDVASGLARVGHPSPDRGARDLADARREVTGVAPFLRRLRCHLERDLVSASLASTARGLAVSERSLQRSLAALGTSFVAELQGTRVRVAEGLLARSDDSLTQVAAAVGAATPAHFSALFRRLRGETPTQFRARARRPPPRP